MGGLGGTPPIRRKKIDLQFLTLWNMFLFIYFFKIKMGGLGGTPPIRTKKKDLQLFQVPHAFF